MLTMTKYCSISMLFLILAALTFVSAEVKDKSPLDRFSREQKEKLLKGLVVYQYTAYEEEERNKQGLGFGQAHIIVNKPIDVCWSTMTNFAKKKEYFPRVAASDVVKKQDNKIWVREVLDFGIAKIEYVMLENLDPPKYRVDYNIDFNYKHDLKDSYGFWYWEKIDDQTSLLNYAVAKVDVGIPVPQYIVKALSSRDLPGVVENVKKRIESNGNWKKDEG